MFAPGSLPPRLARQLAGVSLALVAGACAAASARSKAEVGGTVTAPVGAVDSAVFVTRLGVDTVAIERVVYAVPAGRYTLFSIPERDGGLPIISRQTGQAGTAYDSARDLGRVRLAARPLPELVEVFTIAANSEGSGGVLRLQWDRTELMTPFRVRAP